MQAPPALIVAGNPPGGGKQNTHPPAPNTQRPIGTRWAGRLQTYRPASSERNGQSGHVALETGAGNLHLDPPASTHSGQ